MRLRGLLLAGGIGSRLWPLSTEERPKQFLRLWGDRSLLHAAYQRLHPICEEEVFVATAERYADATLAELPTLAADRLLLEPARRNTAPAILCAALRFQRDGDDVVAAVPADATVADDLAFERAILAAADAAAERRAIVTLGILPTRPETEYGYLETEPRPPGTARPVRRFVEKPDRAAAAQYLAAGNYYWNGGMFVFRPSVLLDEAERACPDLLAACREYDARWRERNDPAERRAYEAIPAISIDYALMEKISGVFCVELAAGWNDVGSYRAIREIVGGDARGNLILSDRPVVVAGISDTVVAITGEGAVVFPLSDEAELRSAVSRRGPGARR